MLIILSEPVRSVLGFAIIFEILESAPAGSKNLLLGEPNTFPPWFVVCEIRL